MSNGKIGGIGDEGIKGNRSLTPNNLNNPTSKLAEITKKEDKLDPAGNLGVDTGKRGKVV